MSVHQDILVETSARLADVLSKQEVESFLHSKNESTPFDSWAWLSSADDALDDHQKCFIVCRSDIGELLGWLPLRRCHESLFGLKFPVLRFLTEPNSDRHSMQVSQQHKRILDEMVSAAIEAVGRWSAIILDEVVDERFFAAKPQNWFARIKRRTPVLKFELPANQDATSAKLINKRGRRARKKIEKLEHTFRVWQPLRDELDDLLSEMRVVEDASWKGQQGVGVFGIDPRYAFFRNVAKRAADTGSLMIGTVHVDGKLASYRFGFLWDRIFYDYNFAYLPEYSNLSLGRVLLDEMIVKAYEKGLRGIDGSRVGASYENLLREHSEETIEHCRVMYFRWTLGGLLLRTKFLVLKPLKQFVRNALSSSK